MVNTFLSYFTAKSLFFSDLLCKNRIIFFFSYQSLRYDDLFDLRKEILEQGWVLSLVHKDIFLYEPLVHLSSVLSRCTAILYSDLFVLEEKTVLDAAISFFLLTGFTPNYVKLDNYLLDLTQFEVYTKKSKEENIKNMLIMIINSLENMLSNLVYFFRQFIIILSDFSFSFSFLVNLNANV